MRVEIYTGLGSQRRKVWDGGLEVIPRIGERVIFDDPRVHYTVDYVHHMLPSRHRDLAYIELYVR